MLVRVKENLVENFYGFYGLKRRYPGDKFELVERETKDGKVVSIESQFSEKWMEKIEDTPKRKRRTREEIDAGNARDNDTLAA